MLTVCKLILAVLVLAVVPWSAARAGGFVGVSIGFPIGGCYHHYPYCGGYYAYDPGYLCLRAVPGYYGGYWGGGSYWGHRPHWRHWHNR